MEPDDVYDEDAIVEDVAKAGKHNQPLPEELTSQSLQYIETAK